MRGQTRVKALTLASALVFHATESRALEPEISSDTSAQFYELRSPTGETVIARRRLITTLGVAGYDLLDRPSDGRGPELLFRARLRYEADYGGDAGESEVTSFGRLVPGMARGPVDLMYGYVEGRRFASGWLGFKLGRQYVVDALGWWSFDGGLVRVTTPVYLAAELYGGLEQRGGLPFSTPRYERDGVWRGNRDGYDRTLWPAYQDSTLAPAFGAALESAGVSFVHGRLTYRRVQNTGTSVVSPFDGDAPRTYEGSRVSQERIGYAMDASHAKLGGVKAGIAYDLYAARTTSIYASVDTYVSDRITVSTDYDYVVPTFDGDSIFNVFMAMPMNDLGARVSVDATPRLSVAGGARARAFQVDPGPPTDARSPNGLSTLGVAPPRFSPMGGGDLSARYRRENGSLGARGTVDVADTGRRLGLDVYGERTFETRYVVNARAGVWEWDDTLREDRHAVSVGYVAGVGYRLSSRSLAMGDFQHDANRLVGSRYRVMLWLSLALGGSPEGGRR